MGLFTIVLLVFQIGFNAGLLIWDACTWGMEGIECTKFYQLNKNFGTLSRTQQTTHMNKVGCVLLMIALTILIVTEMLPILLYNLFLMKEFKDQ